MLLSNKALNSIFGLIWKDKIIFDYGMDKDLDHILKALNIEYNHHTVYPGKSRIFKSFKSTPFDDLKVVFLFQDPYHDGSATGIAVANKEGAELSPTLHILKREWESDTGRDPDLFDPTFEKYCKQGVMFLNTALTVRENEPKSHFGLWHPWTTKFLQKLTDDKKDLVFVLFGNHAKSFKPYILHGYVLEVVHPAAETYSGGKSGFYGSKPFYKVNKQLAKLDKPIIQW